MQIKIRTQAVTRGGKLKIIYVPVRKYEISLSASASFCSAGEFIVSDITAKNTGVFVVLAI